MFDISFSELLIVAVVALIVVGPERLPKVARTLGLLTGRVQRYVSGIKADVERELRAHDLQEMGADMRQAVAGVESTVKQEMHEVENGVSQTVADVAKPGPGKSDNSPGSP